MPGPIEAAGAVRNPSKYGALGMGARQFTGLVTQRSPYRDGAVPYLVGKFYGGSRFDSIWDGLNREITQKLTDARSPGSSIYNSLNFPAINSFYPWKYIQNGVEVVRVLADGADGVVYDATTGQKSTLFTKSGSAGRTRFLGLNTQLYMYDGVDTKKALEGSTTWQPTTNVLPGTLINVGATPGTMFMALGGLTLPIVATSVSGSGSTWHHLVYVDPTQVPEQFANLVGVEVTFSGLTTDTTLNGQTLPVDTVLSTTLGILQVTTTTGSNQAYTVDTGDGSTGNGTTGGSAPSFNATRLAITADAGQQWKSYGTAVQNVGLMKPTVPPTITPVSPTRFWQPNKQFPVYTSLLDSNGNIEVVAAISGTNASGQTYPTWAAAPNPAQLVATNLAGVPAATANTFGTIYQNTSGNTEYHQGWGNVVAGGLIAYYELTMGPTNPPTLNTWGTTFTATDKAGTGSNGKLGFDFEVPPGWYYKLEAFGDVNATPGSWDATPLAPVTTGVSTPGGANAVTVDGGLTWYNLGAPGAWQADTANAGVPGACLIDSNGNLQWLFDGAGGTSGLTAPTWGTTLGATTTDGGLTWKCISTGGSGASLTYQTLQWAYSLHAIDGSVSTASPVGIVFGGILGAPMTPNQLLMLTASSLGMFSDTQIDQVWIWRTAQGQPTLILEDQIPADGLTNSFTYTERDIPDTSANGGAALNPFIPAPVAESNNPPASNMTAPAYYLQRVWGIVDNTVVYSGGPDTVTGNGNTAFPPLNEIPFAAQPIRLLPVLVQNGGLLVMTTSGIKIILGTGTANNPFYVGDYLELVSILNYDAVSVFYNQIFCMESNGKVSSLAIEYPFNPQTGYTEVGFPIGDQFMKTTTGGQNSALFNPATAYVSWNANSSADTGMYVSSGTGFWFRMSLINPPESGILWSPLRQLEGGSSAVQSVETTPGVRNLLIGPPTGTPGPILMRDTTGTVWTDYGNMLEWANATGECGFTISRPLGQTLHGVLWSNFSIPSLLNLPADAVITGIYPVLIASANYDGAVQYAKYGTVLDLNNPGPLGIGFQNPFGFPSGCPDASFGSTQFYGNSIGTSLSALAGMEIMIDLDQSLFQDNLSDRFSATGVGFAVYYTSATPVIEPTMPPPFTVPSGSGVTWALPAAVSTIEPVGSAWWEITQTSLSSSGVGTYYYSVIAGAPPAVGDKLAIAGTTNAGGALNTTTLGGFPTVATATGGPTGSFTVTGLATGTNWPIQAESGQAITNGLVFAGTGGAVGTVATEVTVQGPVPYPAYDAKGVTLLASTGQWAEVVHISTKSKAVGKRPTIGVLLNEIAPSPQRPYRELNLDDKSNDPSKTPRSISAYSDRYVLKQSGANTLGDCLLVKFDYGEQAESDELLQWEILARVHEEREEEAAPVR